MAHLCVSAPAVSVVFKTVHRSLTSAVRSVSSSARDKEQSGQSNGSSALERPALRPRPPPPRGEEDSDGYGDEVELRPTTRRSGVEANAPGADWPGEPYR